MGRFYKTFNRKNYTAQRRLGPYRRLVKLQRLLLQDLLKKARKGANLNQHQVAVEFGQDQSFISKIESGARQVEFVEVERLAEIYQQPLSFFDTLKRIREEQQQRRIRRRRTELK